MIDLEREDGLSLRRAAAWWTRKTGRKTAPTTLWRWHHHGKRVRGQTVYLEAFPSCRRGLVTTVAALARFAQKLAEASSPASVGRPVGERSRASEAAARELEAMGA